MLFKRGGKLALRIRRMQSSTMDSDPQPRADAVRGTSAPGVNGPNPKSGLGLMDFDARSREISMALGLSQYRIPNGVRV